MAHVPENVISRPDLGLPIQIGGLTCRNRVFLAPMSGVSDAAFRKMAWKFGAGLVFSEMVASEALVTGKAEMTMKSLDAGLPIHAVQIAGRQAKWMGLAAAMAQDNGAHLIDINMGCPSRRVTSGLSGSALMRDLDHAIGLIDAVIAAVDVPVTLKMRLGWDDNSINAPQLAARAQASGVAMISVHGRTRCQFYKGTADWHAVAKVKQAINIPLVVNGDVIDEESAHMAIAQSGADCVMIGRGSYGMPWLPGALANPRMQQLDIKDIGAIVTEHCQSALELLGAQIGIRHFRKHLGWYLENLKDTPPAFPPDRLLKRALLTSVEPAQLLKLIEEVFVPQSKSSASLAA